MSKTYWTPSQCLQVDAEVVAGLKEHAMILMQGSSSNDRQKESWEFLVFVIVRQTERAELVDVEGGACHICTVVQIRLCVWTSSQAWRHFCSSMQTRCDLLVWCMCRVIRGAQLQHWCRTLYNPPPPPPHLSYPPKPLRQPQTTLLSHPHLSPPLTQQDHCHPLTLPPNCNPIQAACPHISLHLHLPDTLPMFSRPVIEQWDQCRMTVTHNQLKYK